MNISRQMIVSALEAANLTGAGPKESIHRFLKGEEVLLVDLNLDSLATMEFCIYLELNHGISIIPHDVHQYESLNALVNRIEEIRS
jgi:acyl carrier protein